MPGLIPLRDFLESDPRTRAAIDVLSPEQYRFVLREAAPIFREMSKRSAVPVTIVNDPSVPKSRKIKVVDVGSALHGGSGTGGTFDHVEQAFDDQLAYPMYANWEVPDKIAGAGRRAAFDYIRETARAWAEKLTELENQLLIKGLGPLKGISTATGIDTFASVGAWTTAGDAYKDIVKAVVNRLKTNKAPEGVAALAVNPAREADLFNTFSNTDAAQLEKIQRLLPGGIHSFVDCPTDKAYVYAKSPSVLEYVVYQDLTQIPLPRVDEADRGRLRVIGSTHFTRPLGIVEITSIDA